MSESGPAAGASFTLSTTVRNEGDGDAAATTLRYYRSSDSTITTSDTQVGTDAVGTLVASGSSSESVDLTAPSSAGSYYYGACVDAVAGESDTTNNCSSSVQVDVREPPPPSHPDLVLASPTVSESGPAAGASFTLSTTVRNEGDGDAAATTLRYYRSSDSTITTSDTQVGTDAVGTLVASGSSSESVDLTAPSVGGKLLLRGVRGRGGRRVGHDEQLLVVRAGRRAGAPAAEPSGPGSSVAYGERERPGCGGVVHPVNDGAQRGGRGRCGDDAALLPVVGLDDHDVRYAGGYGCGRDACRFGEQQRIGGPDRAVVGGKLLLRRVRGRGGRRVGHDGTTARRPCRSTCGSPRRRAIRTWF